MRDVDANLAAAQAQLHSVYGSIGWAGAAYSSTAADNIGQANQTPNDLPLTVVSSYPSDPDPAPKSAGAASVKAQSAADSSTATAAEGGPSSDSGSTGRAEASTSASCGPDGTLEGVADNTAEAVTIAGVLRIGSVKSHAKASVDPQGQTHFEATMEIEGVTVLGQPAAITDKGAVVASSVIPLPANPLAKALSDAGVTIEYVAALEDAKRGEVFAPGLNVVVTSGTSGDSTSYVLGRAFARSTVTAGTTVAPVVPASSPPPSTVAVPTKVTPTPMAPAAASPTRQVASPAQQLTTATNRIAAWSIAAAYRALALGVALLLAVRLLFDKVAVRLRWR